LVAYYRIIALVNYHPISASGRAGNSDDRRAAAQAKLGDSLINPSTVGPITRVCLGRY